MNSTSPATHDHAHATAQNGKSHTALPDLFARHGLRCTRQRLALYEALMATNQHPTADELFAAVASSPTKPPANISLATVYNILEAFCHAGLAIKLPGKGSCSRYDASTHSHLHMRDAVTGQVVDAPHDISQILLANLPKHVLDQIEQQLGFKVDQVQIELVGQFVNQTKTNPRTVSNS